MKKITSIFIALVFFYSCNEDDHDNVAPGSSNVMELNKENLSAKWMVDSTADDFYSFEFTKNGVYIIITDPPTGPIYDYNAFCGNYEIIDNTTIELEGLGNIEMYTLNNTRFDFSLTPGDSSNNIIISTTKAFVYPSTHKTDLLCRTWEFVEVYINDTLVDDLIVGSKILYTHSGAYLVKYEDYYPYYYLANWKWKSSEENYICVSGSDTVTCNEYNEIQIKFLGENALETYSIYNGTEYLYKLKPSSFTDTISNTQKGNLKNGKPKSFPPFGVK